MQRISSQFNPGSRRVLGLSHKEWFCIVPVICEQRSTCQVADQLTSLAARYGQIDILTHLVRHGCALNVDTQFYMNVLVARVTYRWSSICTSVECLGTKLIRSDSTLVIATVLNELLLRIWRVMVILNA